MSLVAWYPLSGDLLDHSGNNSPATNTGASINSNGKIGSCYSFNGSTNYMNIPNPLKGASNFTISFWLKSTSTAAWSDILTFDTGVDGTACRIEQSSVVNNFFWYNAGGFPSGSLLFIHDSTKWEHITLVVDSQYAKTYKDGILQYSYARSSATLPTCNTINIGRRLTSQYLGMYLNDLRFYNNALSEKEIYEISKAKILHYKFDDFQEPTTNLIPNPTNEVISASNEFCQYVDLAPIFNTYGTGVKYSLSLDLKSANISVTNQMKVYMQNGSSTKYSFVNQNVTVTTEYQRFYFEGLTPAISDSGQTAAWLAFYGTYGTGNFPRIKNVQIEIKDHCTPFVNGSRTAVVNDCSGYEASVAIGESYTPQWVSDSAIGNGSYKFNGTSSYIPFVNPFKTGNTVSSLTLTGWMKKTADNTAGNHLITLNNNNFIRLALDKASSGIWIYCYYYNGATYANFALTYGLPSNFAIGQWYHIAFTFDRGICKIYVNGTLVQTDDKTATTTTLYSGGNTAYIGSYSTTTEFMNGYIDDARIYATALSASDIQALYNVRGSIDNLGNIYVSQLRYQFPKSAYEIKQKYPNAPSGIYTIQPDITADPFEAYCDMTTDGGGWTLLVCSATNAGWTTTNVLDRNSSTPSTSSDYSILGKADVIKSNIGGNLQYRMDAASFGRWGGSFSAPYNYTFIKKDNTQTAVSLITQYDVWSYSDSGIEQRMPWLGASSGLLTTSNSSTGNWWGTIVSNAGFNPAPWMSTGPTDPGKIWYWVR